MRVAICHYSNSGNTRLACGYVARNLDVDEVDLFDMKKDRPELAAYDLVGFATFTDFWAPSQLVKDFVAGLPESRGAPAFVLTTYGFVSGRTVKSLADWVSNRGYTIVAGHTLHVPESYPPMIVRGRGSEDMPDAKEMVGFDQFVTELNQIVAAGPQNAPRVKMRVGPMGVYAFPRTRARSDMGDKFVDEVLCTECGTCEKGCPYQAILLDPKPVFDMSKCYGCWYCYNHCPEQAIYTEKLRGEGHYPRANDHIKDVLGSSR